MTKVVNKATEQVDNKVTEKDKVRKKANEVKLYILGQRPYTVVLG